MAKYLVTFKVGAWECMDQCHAASKREAIEKLQRQMRLEQETITGEREDPSWAAVSNMDARKLSTTFFVPGPKGGWKCQAKKRH